MSDPIECVHHGIPNLTMSTRCPLCYSILWNQVAALQAEVDAISKVRDLYYNSGKELHYKCVDQKKRIKELEAERDSNTFNGKSAEAWHDKARVYGKQAADAKDKLKEKYHLNSDEDAALHDALRASTTPIEPQEGE